MEYLLRDYDNDDDPVTKDKIVTIGFSFSGKYNKHHVPTIELQLRRHLTKKNFKKISSRHVRMYVIAAMQSKLDV